MVRGKNWRKNKLQKLQRRNKKAVAQEANKKMTSLPSRRDSLSTASTSSSADNDSVSSNDHQQNGNDVTSNTAPENITSISSDTSYTLPVGNSTKQLSDPHDGQHKNVQEHRVIVSKSKLLRIENVLDADRKYFTDSFRELNESIVANEGTSKVPLNRLSSSNGAFTDQRLAETAANTNNYVYRILKRACIDTCKQFSLVAQERVASDECEASDSDSISLSSSSSSCSSSGSISAADKPLVDSVNATYSHLIEEIITENSSIPLLQLKQIVKPLTTAFHKLLIHMLPHPSQASETNEASQEYVDFFGMNMNDSMNMDEKTAMIVNALATIVRKVLFSMTRFLSPKELGGDEKTLIAFITVIAKLSSADATSAGKNLLYNK